MKIFKELLENQQVNRIVENAAQNKNVQGVLLEINPIWIYLWRLNEAFGKDWVYKKMEYNYRLFREFGPYNMGMLHFERYVLDLAILYLETDFWIPTERLNISKLESFKKQIDGFLRFDNHLGNLPTFLIRICLYPNYQNKDNNFENSENNYFQVIYETRPISYLYSNSQKSHRPVVGGISIGVDNSNYGTLGGIFKDSISNKYYGLTCSHVVGDKEDVFQPAPYDCSSTYSKIGKVVFKSDLIPLPASHFNKKNLSNSNEVDIALIEIFENVDLKILGLGNVIETFPEDNLVPFISVQFVGRTSGHKPFLYTDAWAVFYDFEHENIKYRYKDLLQIHQNGKISNLLSTPTSDGDSGAWICLPSQNGLSWGGVVIGGNNLTGYVVSSEKIETWIKNNTSLQLEFT